MPTLPLLAFLLGCAKSPAPSPEPAAEVVPKVPATAEDAPEPEPTPEPHVLRCGGIAGLRCPVPLVCVDDPDDSCVPGRGADCIGRCVDAEEAPRTPGVRRPVSDDPQACKAMTFTCEADEVRYSDASGCGCEVAGKQPL